MTQDNRFRDRFFTVTATSLKTPKRTFRLAQVEQTHLRRPGLFVALAFTVGCFGFAGVFHELLYEHELWVLLGGPVILLPLAAQLGVLTIEYRGMGGSGRVLGCARTLAKVRAAIDDVLDEIGDHEPYLVDRR